jgi:hypothetical protein
MLPEESSEGEPAWLVASACKNLGFSGALWASHFFADPLDA